MLKNISRSLSQNKIIPKFKGSIISLLLGFLTAGLILLFMGGNPILSFYNIFKDALFNNLQKTLLSASILTIASIAHIVAFKTGLFNIGVAGQMFFSGSVSIMIGINFLGGLNNGVAIVILFLISMILGAFVATISGLLKSFFNVHEVVSTILLNWIFFFLAKNFFSSIKNVSGTSKTLNLVPSLVDNSNYNGYIFVVISLVICVIFWFFFKRTTFGFSLKVTGLQKEAARVNGINIKMNTILSMSISGLIAGFAGACLFIVNYRSVPYQFLSSTTLPQEGFYSIAIALLAFSNPLVVFPFALLFSILQEGSVILNINERNISDLIVGTIIYFSAISIIFQRIQLVHYFITSYKYYSSSERKKLIQEREKDLSKKRSLVGQINKKTKEELKEYKKSLRLLKMSYRKQLRFLRKQFFLNQINNKKEII